MLPRVAVGLILLILASIWPASLLYGTTSWGVFGVYPLRVFAVNVILSCAGLSLCYVVMGRRSWARRAAKTAIAFASLFLCFTLFELPALLSLIDYRLVFRTWMPSREPQSNPRMRLDPELLYIHRPGDRFVGSVPGDLHFMGIKTDRRYEVDVRYDRNGFRNNTEIEQADIVMIGDSFVEGAIVPFDSIASSRLGTMLGATVLNLGHSGYGPQQELVALRRFGLCTGPAVVVWVVFEGNDLTQDYETYEAFAGNWKEYMARHHGFAKRSFSRNALLAVADLTRPADHNREFASQRSATLRVPGETHGETMYFWWASKPLSQEELVSLKGAQRILHDAYGSCVEQGIRFLVVFAPIKYRVYHNLVDVEPVSDLAGWRINDLNERMQNWCRSAGIAYLDLTPALRSAANAGTLVYLLDDAHWTAQGHLVVAREIADFLKQEAWLQ